MGTTWSLVALPQWYVEGAQDYGSAGFHRAEKRWKQQEAEESSPTKHVTAAHDDAVHHTGGRSKTACVTGANSGLGFRAATELARRRYAVHMVCRNEGRGRAAVEALKSELHDEVPDADVILHIVDLSDFDGIKSFAAGFCADPSNKLDVLVNNAASLPAERTENADGVESCLATVLGGSFLLTAALMPALLRASPAEDQGAPAGDLPRVIDVSSAGMYNCKLDVSDINGERRDAKKYDGALAYALVKRAQVLLSERWAKEMVGKQIFFASMHPGWADTPGVATSLPSFYKKHKSSMRSAAQGADTVVWLASCPVRSLLRSAGVDDVHSCSGKFWFDRAPRRTHMPFARTRCSAKDIDVLWRACQRLCGFKIK